jgi:multiple sugar transport system substrate-binding protein
MRRFLSFVLVLLIAASAVWATGQKEAGAAAVGRQQRIVHYHWTETIYDPINNNAVRLFQQKHPEVEVRLLLFPDSDRANKIRTALAANGEIDSFALSNADAAEFLSAGQAVPIDPAGFGKASVQEVVSMWTPGSIETSGGFWNGTYYGIPFELSNYVAWANIAHMREAGMDPATDKPKTWEQFAEVGRRLVKEEGGVRVRNGFGGNSKEGVFDFLILLAMMHQLGLDWGSESGFKASMDQPELLARGLQTFTDFVVRDRIWDPGLTDNDRTGFGNGLQSLFLTGGSWYWGVLDTYSVPRADVEPFPYPRFEGGRDIGGVGYGYCLYVSRLARDPALVFEWLDTMASQPNEFIRQGYHQPRVTLSNGQQALDPALATQSIPYYNEVFKGELAKTSVWLSSTRYKPLEDAVWAAISRVIFEGATVQSSVAELQADVRSILP